MLRQTFSSALTLFLMLGAITAVATAQPAGRVLSYIGGENGDGTALVNPQDILVLGDRIVVVERSEPFLQVFDFEGRLRQSTGGRGAGPREFRLVYATAYDPRRRRLLAFDAPLGRVTQFELADTLRFVSSQTVALQVESACFLGDRLFASNLTADGVIHELREAGRELSVVGSFGTATAPHPLSANPLYQQYVVSGHLACDAAAASLTLASKLTGFVHTFAPPGGAQRTSTIVRFAPLVFSASGAALTLGTPANGSYEAVVGIRAESGTRIITVGKQDSLHSGPGDYATYRQVVVDRAGVQQTLAPTHWRLVATSSGRAVCYRTDPEPEIAIVAGARCP